MKHYSSVILAALAVVACSPKSSEEQAKVQEKLPVVSVVNSVVEDVPHTENYSTTVQAFAINNIAPQSVGRIKKLNVEIGDFVKAGDALAEMDFVQLDQAELKLKNSQDELARAKILYMEGGISRSDYEQIELSYKVSESAFRNLQENTVLASPISGVVTARNYDRGDMYSMSMPVYTVQQITPVKILLGVSESDYTKVNKGDKVSVTADALPGMSFTGAIARIYPVMDAATHTFNVEVQVRNENRILRPGMYARAVVDFGSTRSVVVPDTAVQKLQGSGIRVVNVINDENIVEIVEVKLGSHFDGKYQILSGLEEGKRVVTKGLGGIRAGIKVEIR